MKKFVTFLMVGYCMIVCSTNLFSSVYSNNPDKFVIVDTSTTMAASKSIVATDCGTVAGFAFFASDGIAPVNGQGCVDVVAQNFNDILLFQWTMEFNSPVATFSHVNIVNLPDTIFSSQPSGPDLITISWQSANFSGINVPDCEVLFQVCFDAVGQNGDQTPLTFSGASTNIEVREEDGTLLNPDFYPGTLTIDTNAKPPLSLQIQGGQLEENQSSCLAVNASGLTNVTDLTISHSWDPNVLQLDQVSDFNLPGLDASDFTINASAGTVVLNWTSNSSAGETVADGTNIYDLCFTAIGSPGTSSAVSITDTPSTSSATDASGDNLSFNLSSTNVSVISPPGDCGSLNGFSFYASTETVEPNGYACVSISSQDFEDVLTFQWTMFYDSTIIELDSAYAVSLPSGSFVWGRNTNSPNIGIPGPSQIPANVQYPTGTNKLFTVSWLEPSFGGFTLDPDCLTLFNLCFDAVGTDGQTSPIIFSDSPTKVEVADSDSNILLNNDGPFEDGSVRIEDNTQTVSDLSVNIGSTTIEAGNTACIPITVDGFTDVTQFQGSLNWDASSLTFIEVRNFNLAGLDANDFMTNVAAGNLSMNWTSTSGGVTLADGDTVYEVCFQAVGNAGSSSTVSISDTPVTSSATNSNGPIPNVIKGNTSISIASPAGACGSINGLSFYSSTECAEPGEDVCVGISASEFTNVMTFQWSMAYDSTVVELDTVFADALPAPLVWGPNTNSPNVGVPGPSNIPSNFQYPSGTNKVITISWLEPSFSGVTLSPDCQVLFNLCFKVIGNGGQSSPIVFLDRPANVEVADPDSNILLNDDSSFEGSRVDVKTSCSGPPPPAPDVPVPSRVDIVNVNCKNANTGSIDLTFDQNTAGLTFMWTPGNVSTMDLPNVGAGTYALNISNGTKDTTLTYTVNEPQDVLDGSVGDVVQIKCNGASDGAISIVTSGGTAGYTYDWNAGLPDNVTVQNNLSPGNYTVTVMDANGCTDVVGPITISEPTLIQIAETVTDVNCAGRSNGSIVVNPSGGTAGLGYSYNWNVGPPTGTRNNLPAGNYSVTVSDSNNCSAMESYTVGTAAPINITLGSNGISGEANGNDGSIDIEVTGGVLTGLPNGYIYFWSPTGQSTQDAIGLAAGQHTVTVTDAVNCQATATFTVDFVGPSYTTGAVIVNDACINTSNGAITVNFTGGINPQISWVFQGGTPNPPSSFNITGLAPGLYQYTITDGGTVVDSGSEIVSIHSNLNITAASIDPEVNGNDGSINLNPLNGVGPYNFDWSNINGTPLGGNESFLNGLQAGTYQVSVTDNGTGCSSTASFTVEDKRPTSIGQVNTTDVSCPDSANGSVCFEVTQGVPNFMILITGGPTGFVPRNETRTTPAPFLFCANDLPAGTFNITVTDANTSVITETFTINEPPPFSVVPTIAPATNTVNGSINLAITGGTPGYSVNWNGNDPNNLPSGNYSAIITDANGCTFTTPTYSVTRFRIIDVDKVDASCVDATNGSISIEVDGGNQPYEYIWEDASGNDISTTSSVSNLAPGTYTVAVIDNLGIRIVETYVIGEQSTITSTGTLTTNYGGFNVSCNGGSDGRARVNPADGQAPYTFAWNDGQSTREAIDLPAGISSVTVTDNVGCTSITEVTLSQPTAISITEQTIGVKCFGETNGQIQLFTNGGVQYQSAERYIFMWDDITFPPGPTIRNLVSGVYPVTVEDANGCQVKSDIVVTGPTAPLSADVVTTPADENCNGSARAEVIGGTPPYFYSWFNRLEADSSDRELLGLCSGAYVLEVTDANGCTNTASDNVDNTSIECLTTRAVITPDGGGLNEEFIIWCIEQYPDNTLEIYNRWGQLVWEQDDYDNTWIGKTMRGGDVPDGAYFYVFRYTINNEIKQTKGSFTLLRE